MSDSLTDAQRVIDEVLRAHQPAKAMIVNRHERSVRWECPGCGWESEWFDINSPDHGHTLASAERAHLAVEIDKALGGLTRETLLLNTYGATNGDPAQRESRFVGGWTPEADQ